MKCTPEQHVWSTDGDCLRCGESQFDIGPEELAPLTEGRLSKRKYGKSAGRKKPKVNISGLVTTTDWWKTKAAVLARPLNGQCELCGQRRATDAHHRLLTAQGGPDLCSNLAAICRPCHDWCHRNPREAQGKGFIVRPGQGEPWRAKALLLWDGSLVLLDDLAGYSYQGFP